MKCQALGLAVVGTFTLALAGCPEPTHKSSAKKDADVGGGGSGGSAGSSGGGGMGGTTMMMQKLDAAAGGSTGGGGMGGTGGTQMMAKLDGPPPADAAAGVRMDGGKMDAMGGTVSADFQKIYDSIISVKCGGCHGQSGGLNMSTAAMAYANLVGKMPAGMGCTGARVTANDLTKSLLDVLIKYPNAMGNTPPAGVGGAACMRTNRMPKGGMLTAAEVTQIETWIMGGAK